MYFDTETDGFTRDELRRIEDRARYFADGVTNESWITAYLDLAHAANVLDAFLARSTL